MPGEICWINTPPGPRPHAGVGLGVSPCSSRRSHPFPATPCPPCPPCPPPGGAEGDGCGSLQNCSPALGWDRATSIAGQAAGMGTGTGAWDRRSTCPQSRLSPSRPLPRGGQRPQSHAAAQSPAQGSTLPKRGHPGVRGHPGHTHPVPPGHRTQPGSPIRPRTGKMLPAQLPPAALPHAVPGVPPSSPRLAGAALSPALHPILSTRESIPQLGEHPHRPTAPPATWRVHRGPRRLPCSGEDEGASPPVAPGPGEAKPGGVGAPRPTG